MSDTAIATPPAAAPAAASTDIPSNTSKPTNGASPANGTPVPGAPAQPLTNGKPPAGGEVESVKKEGDPADPAKPFLVKVDGKEYHLSQDEVVKLAGRGMSADKKFQEAAAARKDAERFKAGMAQFIQTLRTDPMKILANPKIGVDVKKFAEDLLLKEYQREQMDPTQRELEDAKEQLRQAEEEKKRTAEEAQQRHLTELTQQFSANYEKDIMGALDNSGLPKSRWTVKQIANYLLMGHQRGIELKALDVVDFVRKDYHSMMGELFANMDGDKLIDLMGDTNVKKVNEALLKKVRGNNGNPAPAAADVPSTPLKKMTKEEFRKHLDAKFGK